MSMEEFGVKPVAPARSAADFFAAERVAEIMATADDYRGSGEEEDSDDM